MSASGGYQVLALPFEYDAPEKCAPGQNKRYVLLVAVRTPPIVISASSSTSATDALSSSGSAE